MKTEICTEKERRLYYQTIVYDVCRQMDALKATPPGMGIVCGTPDEHSTEVQDTLSSLLAQLQTT